MRTLSLDLEREVFALLKVSDVVSLRLNCKSLASIRTEHLVSEVHLYSQKHSLERLKAISLHPIFSQFVRSIIYGVDRLSHLSFESWNFFIRTQNCYIVYGNAVKALNKVMEDNRQSNISDSGFADPVLSLAFVF